MKKELYTLLCEKYPQIFAQRHLTAAQTCMCRGFCGKDGWFDLIDTLCAQIQHHIDQKGAPQVVATPVKEKFGALRFYYDGGDSHIRSLVEMAVAKSKKPVKNAAHRAKCLMVAGL